MAYGGPYLGIMACREQFVRRMPGRIAGQTVDRRGKRCWVLTLQTREQHIRREKATSNICTNQGLFALRATIYLALMGPRGLAEAAELCLRKAHYAAELTGGQSVVRWPFERPTFKEFVVRVPAARRRELLAEAAEARLSSRACRWRGGIPNWPIASWSPSPKNARATRSTAWPPCLYPNSLSTAPPCVTLERRNCCSNFRKPGRRAALLPACDVPHDCRWPICCRPSALADAPPPLPELAEPDVVRHFTNLSTLNMSVDTHFYPLGSCTMKYNPKRNERLAALPGLADLHPYQPERRSRACSNCFTTCSRCWPRSPGCRPYRCSRPPGRRAS